MNLLKKIQRIFEIILWNFRLFTLIPVLFSLISSLNFFILGTVEIMEGIFQNLRIFEDFKPENLNVIISHIIGGIDYYLIGIILLIFSFGIYEIFISKLDINHSKFQKNVLTITSLEELKKKLVQVILVALIVSLFKKIIILQITTTREVIYVAFSIFLLSLSSYLMHNHKPLHSSSEAEEE